jgi:alkanesulfonate monooxygenase SsuD/methylene tetrahydromethanopterin reductase-like flavin-dependent oxidoreductase (luciferase family)
MGAVLARATNGTDVAIVQMGSTLPTTNPPIRIAEEYAMLDCISGGRLVAGMPLGTSMDGNLCYGVSPMEQRPRYYEAHDLVLKAWQAREVFAWNGKYYQLPKVNPWPRPIQQPHPPVWVPGLGSLSTWEFSAKHDHCYCYLSYWGSGLGKRVMDGFWEFVAARGMEPNPYRAGFLQLVVVSETDARAEEEYAEHIRYFYKKCLHIAPEFFFAPGYLDYRSLENTFKKGYLKTQLEITEKAASWTYKDFVEHELVIGGGPLTVRQRLEEAVRKLRVGNLMVLLHIGSMPHELTLKNVELFGREVMPFLRDLWDDKWENHWWPARLRGKRQGVMAT